MASWLMTKPMWVQRSATARSRSPALPQADFRDVRADGVPRDVLERAQAAFGEKLLNTRSTTWRGLSEAERAGDPLDLIAANPALMKRPLIVDGSRMYLGWDPETRAALGA